ncbi:hypothetical protein HS041_19860 [Planomonospora sp. ID67723]|uniref:hypothetical protein n=1 Tax=Planomonospora sp. ID67723 TaxID=2738134 RepID=UPI0018C3B5CA|nr:hypothetical protein [Planomonospora sp. ID67723]MBG0830028.1 hypothetical protein [Planomonospora sp. ID67723]
MSEQMFAETPDVITQMVRWALSQLPVHNGHHKFEDVCRELARATISRNILPATGPVSAGGDQGRDFETFRSFVRESLPGAFVSREAGKTIVFTCTLQRKDIAGKIKSDVTTVMAGRKVDVVYAFVEADVTVKLRHGLQEWADRTHGLELEILDGGAIARNLSDPETRWIAQRYLDLPRALLAGAPEEAPDRERSAVDLTVRADALARGPVNAIPGLAEKLARAEGAQAQDPIHAATLYREIAASLGAADYQGHELLMLIRAGGTLEAGGDPNGAAILFADIVEQYAQHEGADEDGDVRHRLARLFHTGNLTSPARERAAAALALHTATWNAFDDLGSLSEAVDALAAIKDDRLPKYAVALGEFAIASDQPTVISDRLNVFSQAEAAEPSSATGIRIKLIIAEVTADWQDIVTLAKRRRVLPEMAALILARYARYLTLTGSADAAIEMWWDAINVGALAGLGDDTAEWLYSVRTCVSMYGPDSEYIETHPLAQAMRASGGSAILRHRRNHYEDAATALRRQKLPRAAHAARRALRAAIAAGHFHSEQFARDLLAEIYTAAGEHARAAGLYVRLSQPETLAKLLGTLEDEYVDLTGYVSNPVPGHRAAAFTGMAVQADLIPDSRVETMVEVALDEWERYLLGATREGFLSPSAGLAALKLLAELTERALPSQVLRLLGLLEPLVGREVNRYRFSDEAHIKVLVGVLNGHTDLAEQAAGQLIRMLSLEASISKQVAKIAGSAIAERRDLFEKGLTAAATVRSSAARLLVLMDAPLPDLTLALKARDALLAPYAHPPGVISYASGLAQRARLVTQLTQEDRESVAEALLTRASDLQEASVNRREALTALTVLADSLSAETREHLFEAAISFAKGGEDGAAQNGPFADSSHPLSLFRFTMGDTRLAVPGLQLASALCGSDRASEVEALGIALLVNADEVTARTVAAALSWLPPHAALTPPAMLIAHPHSSVRALAAVRWAASTAQRSLEIGLRLAEDRSAIVRRTLASTLSKAEVPAPEVQQVLASDRRYSVRRLSMTASVQQLSTTREN